RRRRARRGPAGAQRPGGRAAGPGGGRHPRRVRDALRDLVGVAALRRLLLLAARSLDAVYVLGLQPLRALLDVELDLLSLVQSSVTLRLNRGVVDEHILTAVSFDEAVAFVVVEPLHYAYLRHVLHLRTGGRRKRGCVQTPMSWTASEVIAEYSHFAAMVPSTTRMTARCLSTSSRIRSR